MRTFICLVSASASCARGSWNVSSFPSLPANITGITGLLKNKVLNDPNLVVDKGYLTITGIGRIKCM